MTTTLFAISQYCRLHGIDLSFIQSLEKEGLITITSGEEGGFIEETQLHELEIYTSWHQDLGINPEGIDAIRNLLGKLREMQEELHQLKSRLGLYEQQQQSEKR